MKQRNLHLFYTHETLFQFSDTMLIIVLPIFIYQLFHSISAVFTFTFIWNVFYALLFIPVFNLAMKSRKPKYFMAMGMVFYVLSLWFFGQTTTDNIRMIIPATIFMTLYISFYWMIRHWFFATNTDYRRIGKQMSWLAIIKIITGFAAPIIGGWVSFRVSFNATFILGSLAGLLSLIPILFFHAPAHDGTYGLKEIRTTLGKPELKAIRPAHFWEGFTQHFISNAWILAFALFIGNIKELGILVGVTTLVATLLTRLSGHWFDKRKRIVIFSRLTFIRSLGAFLYASVGIYPHLIYVWGVQLFNRFAETMHQTFADSYLYAYGNKIHPVHFNLNREIYLTIARLISSAILATAFLFLPDRFLWLVIAMGAFMLMGWLTLRRSDHLLG
ncbi:hypothetical protein JW752_02535 [Candidatus Peregrinibacteria bacterium]|nr:hypothetical protein [Candidatus Peregrinibacteria bacterium]